MSKYSRYQPISTNSNSEFGEDYWLKQFENNLAKSAVQSKSTDGSIFDQINSIVNGTKPRYSSVADAVEDMKNRSGLTAYLNTVKVSENNQTTKIAQANLPKIIQERPEIGKTIENIIVDNRGYSPVSAILDKVRTIHQNDVSNPTMWDEDDLKIYISNLNLREKSLHQIDNSHFNLGKSDRTDNEIDPSNTDAFHALTPAKD